MGDFWKEIKFGNFMWQNMPDTAFLFNECQLFDSTQFFNTPIFMPDLSNITLSSNGTVFGLPAESSYQGLDTYKFTTNNNTATTDNTVRTPKKTAVHRGEHAYDDLINKYAAQYGVEPKLVWAVIKAESGFNPNAKSKCNAKGLMQLMPKTAKSYGVTDPYDPEQSVRGGVEMLSRLSRQYHGDKNMILAAYNWGSGNLAKKGFEHRPDETRNYITKVMQYYNECNMA